MKEATGQTSELPRIKSNLELKSQKVWQQFPEIIRQLIDQNPNLTPEIKQIFQKNHLNPGLHSPNWHQYNILAHCRAVHRAIGEVLESYKDQEFFQMHFAQEIDGITKLELFKNFAAFGHDLGKWSDCKVQQDKFQILENGEVWPAMSQTGHEAASGKVIRNTESLVYKLLVSKVGGMALTGQQIEYIARISELHFELGILRNIGKKSALGYFDWLETPEFGLELLKILDEPTKKPYALEIVIFFLADSLGKLSPKLTQSVMANLPPNYTSVDIQNQKPKIGELLKKEKLNPNLVSGVLQYAENLRCFQRAMEIWQKSRAS